MSFSYQIFPPYRLVYSIGWGVLTGADVAEHALALRSDDRFDAGFSQLLDFRRTTDIDVTVEDIRRNVSIVPFGPDARRAFLVSDDFAFGMARMYQSHAEPLRGQILVARDLEEAWEWLRVPPDADVRDLCAAMYDALALGEAGTSEP